MHCSRRDQEKCMQSSHRSDIYWMLLGVLSAIILGHAQQTWGCYSSSCFEENRGFPGAWHALAHDYCSRSPRSKPSCIVCIKEPDLDSAECRAGCCTYNSGGALIFDHVYGPCYTIPPCQSSQVSSYGGTPGGSPSTGQSCQAGSIIRPDSQNVGESMPLVGTPFSLMYFTDRVIGRICRLYPPPSLGSGDEKHGHDQLFGQARNPYSRLGCGLHMISSGMGMMPVAIPSRQCCSDDHHRRN